MKIICRFKVIELQNLNSVHIGPIWIMKFSMGGKVLASAGADKKINVWVLHSQWNHFIVSLSCIAFTVELFHSKFIMYCIHSGTIS